MDASLSTSCRPTQFLLQWKNSYCSKRASKLRPTIGRLFQNRTGGVCFQTNAGSHLMVNAYPFFAFESNSDVISLDYALFRENPGVVGSGDGLRYFSLFDAQIEAVFAAMSALQYDDIQMVVTESGWPTIGEENEIGASIENAAAYNGNLIRRILSGGDLTVYLFALFNENKKRTKIMLFTKKSRETSKIQWQLLGFDPFCSCALSRPEGSGRELFIGFCNGFSASIMSANVGLSFGSLHI